MYENDKELMLFWCPGHLAKYNMCFHSQEVNLNQMAKQEKSPSPVQSQAERDLDNYKELQIHAIQKLEQQMKKQVSGEQIQKTSNVVTLFKCTNILFYRIKNGNQGYRT